MAHSTSSWFEVDKNGLRKLIEQHGKGRLVAELVQNALDENVTTISVRLDTVRGRALAELVVEDDSPDGFRNLDHAFTLFAESYKKSDPTKRGRFNLGEKFIIACCESAQITTTTGTVTFEPDGKRIVKPRQKRDQGTEFRAMMRMTRAEYDEAMAYLGTILVPATVKLTINGASVAPRRPIRTFEAALETVLADENGECRRSKRKTTVEVFESLPDEVPSIYELGLPVVETGDKWHINVLQKVPLNMNRDNVPPGYLRAIRTLVLNEMHDYLDTDDANATWVQQATSSDDCSEAAIETFLDLRFTKHRASYDPNDPEAGKRIQAEGGTVVTGSMLSKDQWANVKRAALIEPAGKLRPSPKPYSDDPNAPLEEIVPADQWTDGMRQIVAYATFLARNLMNVDLAVKITKASGFLACYGPGRLTFNLQSLGRAWFDQGASEAVDRLLIHEFGHQYSGDHLSEDYYEALCKLGATLKRLALDQPDTMRSYGA